MTISFKTLWLYALGFILGGFIWHPIMGLDLLTDVREDVFVCYFIGAVWVFERLLRRPRRA